MADFGVYETILRVQYSVLVVATVGDLYSISGTCDVKVPVQYTVETRKESDEYPAQYYSVRTGRLYRYVEYRYENRYTVPVRVGYTFPEGIPL